MAYTEDATGPHDGRDLTAFSRLMELEREAVQIHLNQPLFVPGLLQTSGYATQMISRIARREPDDPEVIERVRVRGRRAETFQKRLQGAAPPQLWVVMDEAVLRRTVGGAAVMREQLQHLLTLAKLETVHLAVVPFVSGAHAGLGGSFEVHELANGEASVFFEGAHADEIISDEAIARQYREVVQAMAAQAGDARALLESISHAL